MEPITIHYTFRPKQRSLATGHVADLFGLDTQEASHTVADAVRLDVRPGDLVLFTGPSGSGKSSLLRAAGARRAALDAGGRALRGQPLIDCWGGRGGAGLEKLAGCGLGEARLVLRPPDELSDGQRYRFRLAYALDRVNLPSPQWGRGVGGEGAFLLADEFAANLDRPLAKVLAFNVRKLCSRSRTGFLLATTHEDLLDDLNPDLWVRCLGDGVVECERRDVKKKSCRSRTTFGCRRAPAPTGRTSLGGITAAIT